eukprot:TRINITY_DN21613_c0_g1_i1.p1 TRINITY_DN21613_c0_g1~~TRINITY_DN21613_c0_g1_i1.p1  ORF type:complete len:853 (+),score=165.10 TRINITY_DN21613_c0_g1_i1:31-2589(+)
MMKSLLLLSFICVACSVFVPNDVRFPALPEGETDFKSRVGIYIEADTLADDIGTIYLNLAETLADNGHSVTIIFDEDVSSEQDVMLLTSKISTVVLPKVTIKNDFTPAQTWRSYEIYEFLKTQSFDVVHFADWKGNGYFSVMAKHQGLAFDTTMFVVGAQAPFVWSKVNNFERVKDTTALEIDFMQRLSLQYADVVVSPSQFMLNWMTSNGWVLPARAYVQSNIAISSRVSIKERADEFVSVSELVFFGDLMPCQGLVLFCDALDKISASSDLPEDFSVTFLGDSKDVQGIDAVDYLEIRSRRWSFDYTVVQKKDRTESLRYLSVGNRLAVIAPEKANSPLRIQELLLSKIPFIASDIGGISEMIGEESQDILFRPRFDKLAQVALDALANGVQIAKASVCPVMNQKAWVAFHSTLRAVPFVIDFMPPKVSVVITHFNRPEYLVQAIASVEDQTYSNLEVVLVDDASTSDEAKALLSSLKPVFDKRGWQIIIFAENSYLGKARNVGVEKATGEFIIFLDDDNVARPNEVATFVRAAIYSGADVLTSVQDYFTGAEAPTSDMIPSQRRVPLGGDVATGFFWNCFGDANSFVKRSSFLALGGFTEDYQVGYEDYEFFAKAVLQGYSLEVVPEPLFWYRRAFDTMSYSTPLYKNRMRYLRPYVQHLPPSMSNLFLYVQSMHYAVEPPFLGMSNNCSDIKNCSLCMEQPSCGWCEMNRTCQAGDHKQSVSGCTIPDGWKFHNESLCLDCQSIGDDCDACVKNQECGFCKTDNTCYISAVDGAVYYKSACYKKSSDFVTHSAGDCSKSKDKTKLIIIIVCSVGGALLIAAIVGLGVFFMYQRQNKRRGYNQIINQGT